MTKKKRSVTARRESHETGPCILSLSLHNQTQDLTRPAAAAAAAIYTFIRQTG